MHTEVDARRRSAARFFWGWLIVASGFSMSANVAHAVLQTHGALMWIAVGAALVPPSVQIAAAHSISLLVQTGASGRIYRSALGLTVVVGLCAFVLSFEAIRSLAAALGFTGHIAGLPTAAIFPLAIDISIAHATICLLAQSPTTTAEVVPNGEHGDDAHTAATVVGAAAQYLPLAETLVRDGVTRKEARLVADLLADDAAGLGPTAIAGKYGVHHSVVTKVVQAARRRTVAVAAVTTR
ncbi:DUF2637 domain-containing protein [Mycolicibacterium llatzerense]|uniref:DUF2637 domain-containing protein n=1 Tax=Mycolicibacterium llatzerense TaxID=280871 RepID=UPI0008DE3B94|nr:DUF2637 domain-containing protein [Mycolicibacterium llatzerense]